MATTQPVIAGKRQQSKSAETFTNAFRAPIATSISISRLAERHGVKPSELLREITQSYLNASDCKQRKQVEGAHPLESRIQSILAKTRKYLEDGILSRGEAEDLTDDLVDATKETREARKSA